MLQQVRTRNLIQHSITLWGLLFLGFTAKADFPKKVIYYNWGTEKNFSSFTLYSDGSIDVQEGSERGVEILHHDLSKEDLKEWIKEVEELISGSTVTSASNGFLSFESYTNVQTGELAYFPLVPREDNINDIYLYGRLRNYSSYNGRGFVRLDFQSPVSVILSKISTYVTHRMEDLTQENDMLIEAAKSINTDQVFSFKWGTATDQDNFTVYPSMEKTNAAGSPYQEIPIITVQTKKTGSEVAYHDFELSLDKYNEIIQNADTLIANSTISRTPLSGQANEGENTGALCYTPRTPRTDGIEKIFFVYKSEFTVSEDPKIGYVSLNTPMGEAFLKKFNDYVSKKMPVSP